MGARAGLKDVEKKKITALNKKGIPSSCPHLATLAKRSREITFMLAWTEGSVSSWRFIGIVEPADDLESMR
jgi:hypothetical protein